MKQRLWDTRGHRDHSMHLLRYGPVHRFYPVKKRLICGDFHIDIISCKTKV